MKSFVHWLGAAFSGGGADITCLEAPMILIPRLEAALGGRRGVIVEEASTPDRIEQWAKSSKALSLATEQAEGLPIVIGGDHCTALGTWAGIRQAQNRHTALPMGLIWIDAHMDSHRPETSPSGNPHGMVLAALLGYGPYSVSRLRQDAPVLSPHHLTLIGVRSSEPEEPALLEGLGVRIVSIDEVRRRGIDLVLQEAVKRASRDSCGWGLSIDLDALDPEHAPGVSVPEAGGILADQLLPALKRLPRENLLGLELVEYCPRHDIDGRTAQLSIEIMRQLVG